MARPSTTLQPSTGRIGTARRSGLSNASDPIVEMKERQLRDAVGRLFADSASGRIALGSLTDDLSHFLERDDGGVLGYAIGERSTYPRFVFRFAGPGEARIVGRLLTAYADELDRLRDEAARANPLLPGDSQP